MEDRLNSHLSKKQVNVLREKLLAESERIKENFKEKRKEYSESKVEHKDDVDAANDTILITTNMRFTNREGKYLKKIVKALSKFDCDEYGICEECGDQISLERLNARPTSEMCIGCKEEAEMEEKHSIHHKKPSSMGTTMRLR
jgi:DnaK suppressor protein